MICLTETARRVEGSRGVRIVELGGDLGAAATMFKMGCSMAKKILAIDGKSGSSSASSSNVAIQSSSTNPCDSNPRSKGKDKQRVYGEANSTQKAKSSGDELSDFSKLENDPRMPLNVRQIFKITKSWKAIARTMSKTGTAMFLA